jgi:hypothetical protein
MKKIITMAVVVITSLLVFPANARRGELRLNAINSINCLHSWKVLTNTGSVTIPERIKQFEENGIDTYLKRGDEVEIYAGYDTPKLQFKGFLTRIPTGDPLKLECEDYMWKLKQTTVSFSYGEVKLSKLLNEIAPGITIEAMDVTLKSIRMKRKTVAFVLNHLKDTYGISSYFKKGTRTLVCGNVYTNNLSQVPFVFDLDRNVAANNLNYINADDLSIKVKVESLQENGTKLTAEAGDPDGDEYLDEIPYMNKQEAQEFAERRLQLIKKGGFDGSFDAFAEPDVEPGERVQIISKRHNFEGIDFVDSVELKMSDDATFVQTITISR